MVAQQILHSLLLLAFMFFCFSWQCLSEVVFYENATKMIQTSRGQRYDSNFEVDLSEHQRLALPDNSISNILSEIEGVEFHRLLEELLFKAPALTNVPEYRLTGYLNSFHERVLNVGYRRNSVSTAQIDTFREAIQRYISSRMEGHSSAYSSASLLEHESSEPHGPEGAPEEILAYQHWIPRKWLRKSTNDNSYFTIDGPIAWDLRASASVTWADPSRWAIRRDASSLLKYHIRLFE